MKNINEMSLEQKIMELQQCISKARVGAENPGSVDYEVRQQGIRDINNKLDSALLAFPGYGLEEEIKMASGFGR